MTQRSAHGLVRRAARVTGRVQGVSFRYHTVHEAEQLGVTGWVRNTADGSVELEVQGPSAAVDALLVWAETGPVSARVDHVVTTQRALEEGETGFGIRR